MSLNPEWPPKRPLSQVHRAASQDYREKNITEQMDLHELIHHRRKIKKGILSGRSRNFGSVNYTEAAKLFAKLFAGGYRIGYSAAHVGLVFVTAHYRQTGGPFGMKIILTG